MYSPHSIEPWVVRTWKAAGVRRICACSPSRGGKRIRESRAEAGWQMELRCAAAQERPHRTSIRFELTKELCTREACDHSPSTAGQKKTPEQLSKHQRHHRSRRRQLRTSPPAAEPLALPHASQEVPEDNRRKTKKYGEGQWTQKKHQVCRAQAEARSAQ